MHSILHQLSTWIVSLDRFMMNVFIKLLLMGLAITMFTNMNEKELRA